jgi:hypothetical protein
MKINKTVEYGFLIVGHTAKYGNDGFVTASGIAKNMVFLMAIPQEL